MSTQPAHRSATAERHSRLVWVRRLRRGLPLLAVVVVLSVAGQMAWREFSFLTSRTPGIKEGSASMINPTFSGAGRDGRRYMVTARSGVRDAANPKLLVLDRPVVTVTREGDAPAKTVANRGLFQQDSLTLRLEGNVSTEQNGRNVFLADNTVIDTTTGAISGKGFQGNRTASELRADNYTITDSGDRVVLKGGVRARLNAR